MCGISAVTSGQSTVRADVLPSMMSCEKGILQSLLHLRRARLVAIRLAMVSELGQHGICLEGTLGVSQIFGPPQTTKVEPKRNEPSNEFHRLPAIAAWAQVVFFSLGVIHQGISLVAETIARSLKSAARPSGAPPCCPARRHGVRCRFIRGLAHEVRGCVCQHQ